MRAREGVGVVSALSQKFILNASPDLLLRRAEFGSSLALLGFIRGYLREAYS